MTATHSSAGDLVGVTLNGFAAGQLAEQTASDDVAADREWQVIRGKPLPPALGWRRRGAGRSPIAPPLPRWVGSSTNLAGLYPFVLSGGAPSAGVPIGTHMLTGEPIGLDAGEWLRQGWITNTGIYLTGQPGAGKSTLLRRLMWGLAAFGVGVLVPADLKNEHGPLVTALGGTTVALGRGLHRINLLDPGPLGDVLTAVPSDRRARLEQEIQARALTLAEGGLTIASGRPLSDVERLALASSYELFGERRTSAVPTLSDLLAILRELPDGLMHRLLAHDVAELRHLVQPLVWRLELLLRGPLAGLFDGASTFSIPADTPGVCLDLSRLASDAEDSAVAIAMLTAWGWGAALIDAGQATGRRRNWLQAFDEHWRVMRAGAGMVELSDQVTRLNRHRGVQSVMATHSLDDFKALPTEEDRNKAKGMVARCAISVIAAQPKTELDSLHEVSPLTSQEREWVRSWAAPPTWTPNQRHPGRGKYLIKTGERIGVPVRMQLLTAEAEVGDTDTAWRTS